MRPMWTARIAGLTACLLACPALAQAPQVVHVIAQPAASAEPTLLYNDPAGNSSANVTQVMPNSKESSVVLHQVTLVTVKSGILVITYAQGAVALFPQQYVSNVSINRHAAPATGAANSPATASRPQP